MKNQNVARAEAFGRHILAIDSSTEFLGIAAEHADGRRTMLSVATGLRHGETMIDRIRDCLLSLDILPGDLDAIICSRGPGSFTGLRIGMSVAKGMSAGLGIPVFGVSSLDAMAWSMRGLPGLQLCLVDARKQRFYGAWYHEGQLVGSHEDLDIRTFMHQMPEDKADGLAAMICTPHGEMVGSALEACKEELPPYCIHPAHASCFWLDGLLDLGIREIESGNSWLPEEGPEYLRHSHEDLGIHIKPVSPA